MQECHPPSAPAPEPTPEPEVPPIKRKKQTARKVVVDAEKAKEKAKGKAKAVKTEKIELKWEVLEVCIPFLQRFTCLVLIYCQYGAVVCSPYLPTYLPLIAYTFQVFQSEASAKLPDEVAIFPSEFKLLPISERIAFWEHIAASVKKDDKAGVHRNPYPTKAEHALAKPGSRVTIEVTERYACELYASYYLFYSHLL